MSKAPEKTCAVVTDARCDLDAALLERLGVACCSATPEAGELTSIYQRLLENGCTQAVSIHATQAAKAAHEAAAAFDGRVTVIETRLVSAALALAVERAEHAARNGAAAQEVAARAQEVASSTELYVICDSHAPRQGLGDPKDRLAYLRRRALGTRHLVRVTQEGHKVLLESVELSQLTGRIAQTCGTRARTDGALCYVEVASNDAAPLAQLEKPFDTNEYVSFRLAKLCPAHTVALNAGPSSLGVAVVPESVFGGHETSLFL